VRDNAAEGQSFADLVASIKEYGILVALTAVRAADGTITVRDGQRRALAAREAGLTQVPVYLTDDNAADDKTRTVQRITHQIVANDHRAALSEGQRAKGIQQLLVSGLTPTKVSKALTVPKRIVEAAAVAVQSETALAALDNSQLTIEQSATLVEFQDDAEATEYLTAAKTPGEFDHRVSELRHKAAAAAARVEASGEYQSKGYTVLDQRPQWNDPIARHPLHQLCSTDGKSVKDDVTSEKPELWGRIDDSIAVAGPRHPPRLFAAGEKRVVADLQHHRPGVEQRCDDLHDRVAYAVAQRGPVTDVCPRWTPNVRRCPVGVAAGHLEVWPDCGCGSRPPQDRLRACTVAESSDGVVSHGTPPGTQGVCPCPPSAGPVRNGVRPSVRVSEPSEPST
jgi:ParB-like chromosome segregation protein Spo0J